VNENDPLAFPLRRPNTRKLAVVIDDSSTGRSNVTLTRVVTPTLLFRAGSSVTTASPAPSPVLAITNEQTATQPQMRIMACSRKRDYRRYDLSRFARAGKVTVRARSRRPVRDVRASRSLPRRVEMTGIGEDHALAVIERAVASTNGTLRAARRLAAAHVVAIVLAGERPISALVLRAQVALLGRRSHPARWNSSGCVTISTLIAGRESPSAARARQHVAIARRVRRSPASVARLGCSRTQSGTRRSSPRKNAEARSTFRPFGRRARSLPRAA
jgi:hypothetical protein